MQQWVAVALWNVSAIDRTVVVTTPLMPLRLRLRLPLLAPFVFEAVRSEVIPTFVRCWFARVVEVPVV